MILVKVARELDLQLLNFFPSKYKRKFSLSQNTTFNIIPISSKLRSNLDRLHKCQQNNKEKKGHKISIKELKEVEKKSQLNISKLFGCHLCCKEKSLKPCLRIKGILVLMLPTGQFAFRTII